MNNKHTSFRTSTSPFPSSVHLPVLVDWEGSKVRVHRVQWVTRVYILLYSSQSAYGAQVCMIPFCKKQNKTKHPQSFWIQHLNTADSSSVSSRHSSIKDQCPWLHSDRASQNSKMTTNELKLTSPVRTIDAFLETRQRKQKLYKGKCGDFR